MSDKTPKKFVGLHAHSTFSIGDAIGRPQEHIDFARENGMDALALTDHGNMNGFSHQYLYGKKLKKQGINFKALPGCEAYFVPSLDSWKKLYDQSRADALQAKLEKKAKETNKQIDKLIADVSAGTKADLITGQANAQLDDEMQGDTGVEDEEASKSKWKNPLFQRNHLVLLPKNTAGLKALFSCISDSFIDGFYRFPRMDFAMLEKHAKGNIVASSACVAGMPSRIIFDNQVEQEWDKFTPNDDNKEVIQKELAEMVARFHQALGPENFYLELQFNKLGAQHLANYHILECSKRTGVKVVTTCDSHYSNPTHWREREIYRHMAMLKFFKGKEVDLPESVEDLKCELYPKNAEQVWSTYKNTTKEFDFYDDDVIKESIERTHEVAHEQIEDVDMDRRIKFPAISRLVEKDRLEQLYKKLGEGKDEDAVAFAELKRTTIDGARWRGVAEKDEYIARLKTELEVVKHLKFSKYFLTYTKIMKTVGEQCLTGPGRGSAAGSLLAYVLDITQVDPIKHNLLFERFLSIHKKGLPDIDSDVSDRDKSLKILASHFDEENVIPVSNFNQLQMRSLVKDISRINGVSFQESNDATKKIEAETKAAARREAGFDATQWFLTFEAAVKDSPTFRGLLEKYPEFEKMIKVLFKNNRNISRHAGGVIIANNTKTEMPVVKSGGVLQTPWTEGLKFRHLESFGFLKYDILGLGTLRMFEACIRRILKKNGVKYPTFKHVKDFYYENLHADNNEMTDMKVYRNVYWKRNYAGVFQFVRPQVQEMMAKMKPRSIKDIAIITSLYRPGPLSVHADKAFLKNRKTPSSIVYKHPLLREVLEDTSGLIIFQEQLQLIYHKLAGVPLDETDAVRKAFTKKDASNKEQAIKDRQQLREDFIVKCQSANNIPPRTSGAIFDEMEKYVKYSFNLSHAVSYATISYQCAWFLTYYPDEWVATYVDYCTEEKGKVSGYEDPKAVALSEAKDLGYDISKPDINISDREFTVTDEKLVPSFGSIKNVGVTAQGEIYQHRPYKTVEDLLWNANDTWRHSKFNKRSLAALVKLEALDSLDIVGEGKTFENYRQLHHVVVDGNEKLKRAISRKNQTHKEVLAELIEEAKGMEDWSLAEKVKNSKDLAGSVDINMIVTPEIREFFKSNDIDTIDNWKKADNLYWAIVEHSTIATTKTGKKYCRVKLYGDSGTSHMCFLWNYNEFKDENIPENALIMGNFKKSGFGLSTNFGKFNIL
jgi:DNA polymerase-3 subunit alpha